MRTTHLARRLGSLLFVVSVTVLVAFAISPLRADTLPRFDFTQGQDLQGWQATHDVANLSCTPEGLRIPITGNDPYLIGPPRDYPVDTPLWLHIRLKSDQGGAGQIFYFDKGPSEENSLRFVVRAGKWEEARLPLPALGGGYRFRFDPPGEGGTCVVASLSVEPRLLLKEPQWPRPDPVVLGPDAITLQSGNLKLMHSHHQIGGFVVSLGDQTLATGVTRPMLGYLINGQARYVDVAHAAVMTATKEREEIIARATFHDADGANWIVHRSFTPGPGDTINVLMTVQADRDRNILFLPLFAMLPGGGPGSFGEHKTQALLPGLEYLDREEPSSSEADIRGPGANRRTPDSAKITFPLMVVQSGANYVGMTWDKPEEVAALFDSPDRTLHGGGHLLGLLYPGSDGSNRVEGSLLPYEGKLLRANKPFVIHATILGGRAADVTVAVQQYLALHPLPAVPKTNVRWQEYMQLVGRGYLDSGIYADDLYRHTYQIANAQPGGDVAVNLRWLAQQATDRATKSRLFAKAEAARAHVPDGELNVAGVGHVRYPLAALVYGHVEENAARTEQQAKGLLARFEPNGSVLYHAPAEGNDLGKTHFALDANGLTAQVVTILLESATVSGDTKLIAQAIEKLRALDKFAHTVPRGAQTWEVPLHTPDILASAYLVRAYTLGYEITGERHFLEQARYWAWTGVPFVYLINPTEQAVGLYATIAVYGATQWIAPNWMGLPVQWCGLVYADALYRFLPHDPTGPWKQLADGITASGVQQTWPLVSATQTDKARQGLLPDSFNLRAQSRNDPAINPGTLFVNAIRLYDKPALYDFHAFRSLQLFVHAPGTIDNTQENGRRDTENRKEATKDQVVESRRSLVSTVGFHSGGEERHSASFVVHGWPDAPYYVLISGLKATPTVRINRQQIALSGVHQFVAEQGRLILQVKGTATVEVIMP